MALLLVLVCLVGAPSSMARERATRAPVQQRTLALPAGIDTVALREQLRVGYAADVDADGSVVIVTRKRDVVDRIVVELAERQLVARFYRSGASVNPKYAANQLDVVIRAVEAYTRRIGATHASARKGARDEPASRPPASAPATPAPSPAPPTAPAPAKPRTPVAPPAPDGERLQI